MIQIFSNSIGKEELDAVEKVFKSKWGGAANETLKFEEQFGERINSKYALSFNCATAATYGAMKIPRFINSSCNKRIVFFSSERNQASR